MNESLDYGVEKLFVDNPIIQRVNAWDDPDLSYDSYVQDYVRTELGWYIISGSSCSCYGPWDNEGYIDWGPGTLDELGDHIEAEYNNERVRRTYAKQYLSMRAALEELR